MNVTARIESTGAPGRIHCSRETAQLVQDQGKPSWLRKRDDKISAKGKGDIQTFWVTTRDSSGGAALDELDGPSFHDDINSPGNKHGLCTQRVASLVDWNVQTFLALLKQVIAHRASTSSVTATARKKSTVLDPSITLADLSHTDLSIPLDDVREIIALPEFDQAATEKRVDPSKITVPEKVSDQLRQFIVCIAERYHNNAFHNFEHASHVTMAVIKLLSRIVAPTELEFEDHDNARKVAAKMHDHTYGITSDPLTQFACALAALIHDVDHVGVPNAQLIREESPLASKYDGRSVAEQNSFDLAYNLLSEARFTELRECICATIDEQMRFRSIVINCVMATDIVDKELKALRNGRWERAFNRDESLKESRADVNRKATIVIEHLIQASDISHTMQHWHIYRKWNERLFEECYVAFKAGRADKDPSIDWYKGEIGFFDFYIIPLAKKLKDCGVFGKSSDEFIGYAKQNREEWAARGQEVVAAMVDRVKARHP